MDCTRETFMFGPGGICVYLDRDFGTGFNVFDFLNDKHPTIKRTGQIQMRVKYEKYIPEILSRMMEVPKNTAPAALVPVQA